MLLNCSGKKIRQISSLGVNAAVDGLIFWASKCENISSARIKQNSLMGRIWHTTSAFWGLLGNSHFITPFCVGSEQMCDFQEITTHTSSWAPPSPQLFRSENLYFLYRKYLGMENTEITVKQIVYLLLALTPNWGKYRICSKIKGIQFVVMMAGVWVGESLTSLAHTSELTWVSSHPLKSLFLFGLFPLGWPVICTGLIVWPF